MAPPRKDPNASKVDLHVTYVPMSAPVNFVDHRTICYTAANSVHFWDLEKNSTSSFPTPTYAITKMCSNDEKGLIAFCEGGAHPQVYVFSVNPYKLLFTLSDLAELELADMAFSSCGSRLYALSRATSKKLTVFSMKTGQLLPGCEIQLPLRFDKVCVYPGHKDHLAVVRSSTVRIISISKSFETYISKLQPSSIPGDIDLAVSAYSWTPAGHFLVATRQGMLCTLDGATGALLYICQAEQPITSITLTPDYLITSHIGNTLNFWELQPQALAKVTAEDVASFAAGMALAPQMALSTGMFQLKKVADLESVGESQPLGHRLLGQVASIQATSSGTDAVLTTAEGEVWTMKLPGKQEVREEEDEFAQDDMYVRADQLQMSLLCWFHTHTVTALCPIGSGLQVCASADEGGRLRLWQVVRGEDAKGFKLLRFTSAVTSLAVEARGKFLLAGTDSGCIHAVAVDPWPDAEVVDTNRISEVGIAKLCCTGSEDGLSLKVAALLFDGRIAMASFSLREPKVKMLGLTENLGMVEDICWHEQEKTEELNMPPKLLAVGCTAEASCLWTVRSPKDSFEPRDLVIHREAMGFWSQKLAGNTSENRPTAVCSLSKTQAVVGFASGAVCIYATPTQPGLMVKSPAATPMKSLVPAGAHHLVNSLQTNASCTILMVGCMDGSVLKLSLPNGEELMCKTLHSPYNGGTAQVVCSRDSTVAMSTGGADGILVWSEPGSEITVAPDDSHLKGQDDEAFGDETAAQFAFELDDTDVNAFPAWVPPAAGADAAKGDDEEVELSEEAAAKRKLMTHEIEALRKKLRILVDHNSNAPDLEKLDRSEFCVDFEERDAIGAKSKLTQPSWEERCDALRAEIEHQNVARQLIRDRLIKEFWDPMRGKGCQITSLTSTLAVSNYPERTVSEEESTITRKLRMLRKSEQLEFQMLKDSSCPTELKKDMVLDVDHFASGKEQYVVNWWPGAHSKASAARAKQLADAEAEVKRIAAEKKAKEDAEKQKEKDKGGKEKDKGEEIGVKMVEDGGGTSADSIVAEEQKYLYEPFELVTNSRRRLQIHLLQCLSADYRMHFNELFKACQGDKRNIIDGIKEKCSRIRQILGELQIEEEVPEPKLQEVEDCDSVLKVQDHEIAVEKWISPEERKARDEAAAKEEERLRQLRENDAGQRALVQMMGGTLKTKKDLTPLEIVLDKEAWMDEIPEDDMTELQKAAFTEYQAKEKALAEAQDAYKKQLSAELKSLRAGVQELTLQFEGLLKRLHHERFAHDAKFLCQELYCARLQLALLQNVEDNLVREQAELDLEGSKGKVMGCEQRVNDFTAEVQRVRGDQDDRARYEKEVSSAQHFRQAFANSTLEANAITALLQLFRKKKELGKGKSFGEEPMMTATRSTARKSVSGIFPTKICKPLDVVVGDPYIDLGAEPPESLEPQVEDDIKPEDCPEGVDEESFKRMHELRAEKLRAEVEVAKGAMVLSEMGGFLSHLERECADAKGDRDRLERELREHKELMNRELYDVEILFKLKQGQVEVPQAAVVTDYSDAIVIDQEVVESRNRRITDLGKDKVHILTKIKEFRKSLSLLDWEHEMLALQTTDLEERTKDVHMLRVTKDLQSLLKGGEEGRNKAESDLLERKIEHLSEATEKKEQALKKQHSMVSHAAKLRKNENTMLEKKLRELQQNVIQREHIRRLRGPAGGGQQKTGGGGRVEEDEGAAKAARAAFKELRSRQRLMEAAKKNTEEIEILHKELDRLRQRTFPSFVQLHEDRPSNPDFR